MAKLTVLKWPNEALKTKAQAVSQFDQNLRDFIASMHETMQAHQGIGLAANQVGDLRRILVINIPYAGAETEAGDKQWWHDKDFTCINPRILKKSGKATGIEGCLSFPEIFDYVKRAKNITVEAEDSEGKSFTIEADGLLSICLQHEIDHLDGIVFVDRMSRLKAQLVHKKIQKTGLS